MLTDKEIRKIIDQGPGVKFMFIKELLHKIDQLEKRVQALESIITKDSQKSSNPPSSDIFRKIHNSRKQSGKKTWRANRWAMSLTYLS